MDYKETVHGITLKKELSQLKYGFCLKETLDYRKNEETLARAVIAGKLESTIKQIKVLCSIEKASQRAEDGSSLIRTPDNRMTKVGSQDREVCIGSKLKPVIM